MALNLRITNWLNAEAGEVEDEETKLFLAEIERESDRSAVLVTAALIEEVLSSKCRDWLRHGTTSARDALLSGTGGLATLSSKIDFLFCAGILSENLRNPLHALRRLRNRCAHSWTNFQLDHDFAREVLPYLNSRELEQAIEEFVVSECGSLPQLTPRMRFELAAGLLMIRCKALSGGGPMSVDVSATAVVPRTDS